MAVADILHALLLNRWAEVMKESIWRFNQMGGAAVLADTGTPVYTSVERDFIANALAEAVKTASEYLGFPPRPTWLVDELVELSPGKKYDTQTVATQFGYVEAFGVRAVTALDGGEKTVSYSDTDSDGIQDLATITLTVPGGTLASEIEVFFRQEDGAPADADERWQIYPLKVVVSGTSATITGHKALFVHPKNVWAKPYTALNSSTRFEGIPGDSTHFVDKVDVYRVYANPTGAVKLQSHPREAGANPAEVEATAWLRDAKLGLFSVYTATGQTAPFAKPYLAKVSYRAGYPLTNGLMERRLEVALARYANLLMPHMPHVTRLAMWQEDHGVPESLTAADAENPPPLGIQTAGIAAWRVIQSMKLDEKARRTSVEEDKDRERA